MRGVAVAPVVGAWTPRAHGAREGRVRGFLGGALRAGSMAGAQGGRERSAPGEEGLISRSEIKARSPPQAAPSNSAARGGRQTQFNGYKPSL